MYFDLRISKIIMGIVKLLCFCVSEDKINVIGVNYNENRDKL
jgi:hypothetical protein